MGVPKAFLKVDWSEEECDWHINHYKEQLAFYETEIQHYKECLEFFLAKKLELKKDE